MAYNFKWSRSEIMDMTRRERLEWIRELRQIHKGERMEQSRFIENDLVSMLKKNDSGKSK